MSNLAHPAFAGTVGAVVKNPLQMPGKDIVLMPFKVAAGQQIAAGTVLGFVSATGYAKTSLAAAGDGSEIPRAVAMEDIDTTGDQSGAPRTFSLIVEGTLNESALVFGTGHTADTVRIPLRDRGIYLNVPMYSYA
jgi:hypothetical protein